MELSQRLAVARGDVPADLLLRGGSVIDVFSGDLHGTDVAIAGEHVVALGNGYRAHAALDLDGAFVAPGLIDAHVHIESSMVTPREFAAAVLPHGVTCVVSDPHEIANVLGLDGVDYMLCDAEGLPVAVYVNAPSCVPSTTLSTGGAELDADRLRRLLDEPRVLGLAEVMDCAGVIAGEESLLRKLRLFAGRCVDGHAPGLAGPELNAYLSAGITSDHECTTAEEARNKLALGMTVFVREGSVAHDLRRLLPLIDSTNERRFCFCTDDRSPQDLVHEGSIDHLVRMAIAAGLEPMLAMRMATLNAAEHFGLRDRGAVAPGRRADLIVFRDLEAPRPEIVLAGGRVVARDGRLLERPHRRVRPPSHPLQVGSDHPCFEVAARGPRMRVIGIVPGELRTESLIVDCPVERGRVPTDPRQDLLKLAVIERHRGTGNVGVGFVRGMGLDRGALAGTVAHDHHNLIVVGADDRSMYTAVRAVTETCGGLAAALGDDVLECLPLPIAGLMSERPCDEVAAELQKVTEAARALGATPRDPFMTLSFLGLEVIPSLKLTDRGLVDADTMQVVSLFVEQA